MLYKNYSIWIQRNTSHPSENNWEALINWNCLSFFDSWCLFISDTSPKNVYELAKIEIELYEIKLLKRKMNKSVAEILKLDGRNNRHKQI